MIDFGWQDDAMCRTADTSLFYVEADKEPEIIASLKLVCKSCPVLKQCRSYAIKHEDFGFWAGMTQSERRRIKRKQRRERRDAETMGKSRL